MKRVLAAAVLMAFLPSAHAQDKGKTDFSVGGEFRLRDTFEQNQEGKKDIKPSSHNGIDQRFKLGLNFKANEKFSAHATLLQSAAWGQGMSDKQIGDRGTSAATAGSQEPNFMSVNEAYGTWMISDDFHAKAGRMNFGFGDGAVMGTNDWEAQPYAFDGLTLGYEAEFGKFTFFGFKYRDYSIDNTISNTNSTTSDPQHDAYGLVFDLKTKPEWLTSLNAHVIQDVGDTIWGQTLGNNVNTTANINTLRYGVGAGFGFAGFDLKADAEMVSGKTSQTSASGAVTDPDKKDIQSSMYQAELGYSMPALMGSRWYVGYHMDSGTKATDTKAKTYDGYFHELHCASGCMDIVGWGNLTYIDIGWTLKPTDSTDVGLQYFMFSKSEKDGNVNGGVHGHNLFGTTANKAKIGDEVDLWAEHKYMGGFSMLARLSMFMPGDALKDSSLTTTKSDSITQFLMQAKMSF